MMAKAAMMAEKGKAEAMATATTKEVAKTRTRSRLASDYFFLDSAWLIDGSLIDRSLFWHYG